MSRYQKLEKGKEIIAKVIILSENLKFVQNKELKSFTFNFRGSDKGALIFWDDVDFTTRYI